MADSETTQAEPQTDIAQQVTSKIPTTQPAKNPKRVAAGKIAAAKTKEAREAQKKAAEAAEAAGLVPPLSESKKPAF